LCQQLRQLEFRGVYELKSTKKNKTPIRRDWTAADIKALKSHSKKRTPVEQIAKKLKRTAPALRMKASQLKIGLGHQR